ncbi:Isochorismatase hydrolase [Mollisia scopiformis]|uniref:Isochorismatase hydrolase n=1 Tax=Mollisia scopiformis TaxID=149040 RepID=A0A194X2W9_MOLSC|nr:Isochorismatase hydrolase [Mollisia scopiformis]KUJ14177.1 Isochorismatase hydrolase [Mollisia scopiformis]
MKFSRTINAFLVAVTSVQGFTFDRLNKSDAALLVVDHQIGLSQLVRDYGVVEFRNSILAHAAIGKLFDLPTILTTSADTGPNGALPKEIIEMHPTAPFIHRQGEVDAWDNPDFKAAVQATGKKQIILAGIVTEVCTSFLALSLIEEGYDVWANTEASGTFDSKLAADANRRMEDAGVHLIGMFGIVMDLMRDWRNTPGALEVLPFLDEYLPQYSLVARAHGYAVDNGTLIPGEAQIL